jgi:hypothetical protein
MSKLHDLLPQFFSKGYDGKTAPAGTTSLVAPPKTMASVAIYTRHEPWPQHLISKINLTGKTSALGPDSSASLMPTQQSSAQSERQIPETHEYWLRSNA